MEVSQRQAIERRVVRHLIRTAKAHGYALVRVWDGEESIRVSTERDAMDTVFSVDESRIVFKHPSEPKAHCAVIVLGNDGWDAVADSSEGGLWDAVMEENSRYADRLCPLWCWN